MAKTDWKLEDVVRPEDMNTVGAEINANTAKLSEATSAATLNTIMQRGADSQAHVGVPTAATHIARKQDVDAVSSTAVPKERILSDGSDLNNAIDSGFYRLGVEHKNAPTGIDFGQLIVSHGGGDTIMQIATGFNNYQLYWRQGNPPQVGGSGSWGPWHKIYHSGNGGLGSGVNADLVRGTVPVIQTEAEVTLYVSPTGSDSNDGKTSGTALQTIQTAIKTLPQLDNHTVKIMVADGTYNEDVYINGFVGKGLIYLIGNSTSPGNCKIKSLAIHQVNTYCDIAGFTVTGTGPSGNPVLVDRCRLAVLSAIHCTFPDSVSVGITVGSSCASLYNCQLSNKYSAVRAFQNASVFCVDITGSGNSFAFAVYDGAKINCTGTAPGATNSIFNTDGGNGVVNPWGDNTSNKRSFFIGAPRASQAIAHNTVTKVIYDFKITDQLGEYNESLSRFTAKISGFYLIEAGIDLIMTVAGAEILLHVYVNGTNRGVLGHTRAGSTGFIITKGTAVLPLNAGDDVEIYCQQLNGSTVDSEPNGLYTFFKSTRVG